MQVAKKKDEPLTIKRGRALSGRLYLISNTRVANYLKVSVSTAFSYKEAARNAGLIRIYTNKQYYPSISKVDIKTSIDALRRHNPRLRIDDKGCYEFTPDTIQFDLPFKKKKKIEKK